MSAPRRLAACGLLVTSLALTACGGSQEPAAAPASPSAQAPSPSPSVSAAASASAAPVGEVDLGAVTPAGAQLKIGEKAVFAITGAIENGQRVKGTVGVTVTAITAGKQADLAPLKLGDQAKGLVPHYTRITITNESGSSFARLDVPGPRGLLADGSRAQTVSIIGDFAPCDGMAAPKDFTTKGASYEICEVSLAPAAAKVTGAQSIGPTVDVEGAPDYGRDPVVWGP